MKSALDIYEIVHTLLSIKGALGLRKFTSKVAECLRVSGAMITEPKRFGKNVHSFLQHTYSNEARSRYACMYDQLASIHN
jgi:hypothetical protein